MKDQGAEQRLCHGLKCQSTSLIEDHITRGFARYIRRPSNEPNMQLRWDRVGDAKPQLGEYDSNEMHTLRSLASSSLPLIRSSLWRLVHRSVRHAKCNRLAVLDDA